MKNKDVKAQKFRLSTDADGQPLVQKDVPLSKVKVFTYADWRIIEKLKLPKDEIWVKIGEVGDDGKQGEPKKPGRPKTTQNK